MTSLRPAEKRLQFAAEPQSVPAAAERHWKLLIVDDDPEVHNVTRLALDGFHCHGRELQYISAYSGAEALQLFQQHPDIALILLDVVMENEHAGLDVVKAIREEFGNHFVRIILRTGQPGQAPEHQVITEYDINDYKQKTELTRQKLFTAVYTGISSYRDLIALDCNRRGLEKVIEASARIFDLRALDDFAEGVLQQLIALLYLDQDAVMVRASGLIAKDNQNQCEIIASCGRYKSLKGPLSESHIDPQALRRLQQARSQQCNLLGQNDYVGRHKDESGIEHYLYVSAEQPISLQDQHLIELFITNVAIAYSNAQLLCRARQLAGG